MSDYKAMSYQQIADLLEGYGSRIGAFNQTTFRTDIGQRVSGTQTLTKATFGGKSLGGGYCAGVCLDWARRVLLSAPNRDASALSYGYDKMKAGEGTKDVRTLAQSKDRAFSTVGRMASAWGAHNDMNWTSTGGSTDPYELTPQTWTDTAKTLDTRFDASRKDDQRGVSTKRFSSVTMVASKTAIYNSAGSWMASLLGGGLRAGSVSKLGFNGPSGKGHAVAVWQRKNTVTDPDSFYFFDPNFGVFAYPQAKLQSALQILFWKDAEDTPRYDECTSASAPEMDYIIFGPPHLVSAQPGHAVIAVPSVTAQAVTKPSASQPSTATPKPTHTPTSTPTPITVVPSHMASGYGSAAPSLPSPGKITPKTAPSQPSSPSTSPTTGGGSPLKQELVRYRDDSKREIQGAFGTHGTTKGGWVSVPYTLIQKIKSANLTTSDFVMVGPGGKYAVARQHIDWLIERA